MKASTEEAVKQKMSPYFAVFNLHCNDAGKRADREYKKRYGLAAFRKEVAPLHEAGIMSIFAAKIPRRHRVWIRLVTKFVNEDRA